MSVLYLSHEQQCRLIVPTDYAIITAYKLSEFQQKSAKNYLSNQSLMLFATFEETKSFMPPRLV